MNYKYNICGNRLGANLWALRAHADINPTFVDQLESTCKNT